MPIWAGDVVATQRTLEAGNVSSPGTKPSHFCAARVVTYDLARNGLDYARLGGPLDAHAATLDQIKADIAVGLILVPGEETFPASSVRWVATTSPAHIGTYALPEITGWAAHIESRMSRSGWVGGQDWDGPHLVVGTLVLGHTVP